MTRLAPATVRKGICVVLGAAPGAASVDLARGSEGLVVVADTDPAALDRVRTAAAAAGVLGRRLYAVRMLPGVVPMAGNSVDLVVVPRLGGEGALPALAAEIDRVLSPCRGMAVLPVRAGAARVRLAEIAADFRAAYRLETARMPWGGDAVLLHKGRLPGTEWWTHPAHTAGNLASTADAALQGRALTQYRALPYYGGSLCSAAASAGGRHAELAAPIPNSWHLGVRTGILRVRSLYNGCVLWDDRLPPDVVPPPRALVLTPDALYVPAFEAPEPTVAVLDPETGRLRTRIRMATGKGSIRWLALSHGVLAALIDPAGRRGYPRGEEPGEILSAWDLATASRLWVRSFGEPIRPRDVALDGDRLYFFTSRPRLVAMEVRRGVRVWESASGPWRERVANPAFRGAASGRVSGGLLAGAGRLCLRSQSPSLPHLVFAADDGRFQGELAAGDPTLELSDAPSGRGQNGPAVQQHLGRRAWAAARTALSAWQRQRRLAVRPDIWEAHPPGTWVAGGVNVSSASGSGGCSVLRGTVARMPDAAWDQAVLSAPAHGADSSFSGPPPVAAASGSPAPADWDQHRAGPRRAGFLAAVVPEAVEILWEHYPERAFAHTPAGQYGAVAEHSLLPTVSRGETIASCATTGQIQALDPRDGTVRWTFHADGPVLAVPEIRSGALVVPSTDGCVYRLDLEGGRVLQRVRAAPAPRWIHVYGRLHSTWPVLAPTGFADGRLLALAGMDPYDGCRVVRWRPDAPSPVPEAYGMDVTLCRGRPAGLTGALVRAAGEHWVGTDRGPLRLPVPPTGASATVPVQSVPVPGRSSLPERPAGRELVAFRGRWLIQAGMPLFSSASEQGGASAPAAMVYPLGATTAVRPVRIGCFRVPPVTDGKVVAVAPGQGQTGSLPNPWMPAAGLALWDGQLLEGRLTARGAGDGHETPALTPEEVGALSLWERPGFTVQGLALAANAVVATHGEPLPVQGGGIAVVHWYVSAFRRAGGAELWRLALPSEPVPNGLTLAAGGRIFVPLRDGTLMCLGATRTP